MTSAAFGQNVVLTMTIREAEFLRSLVGSLAPIDFDSDHPAFTLVSHRHPHCVEDNRSIAGALIDLLGTGLSGPTV